MAEMRKLTAYFSLLSGDSRWDENAERIFDDLFHKDVTIVGVHKRYVVQRNNKNDVNVIMSYVSLDSIERKTKTL